MSVVCDNGDDDRCCEQCRVPFGYRYFSSAAYWGRCQHDDCEKQLCYNCAGEYALIPYRCNSNDKNNSKNTDIVEDSSSKNYSSPPLVQSYCKSCFEKIAVIDFTRSYDIIEPEGLTRTTTFVMVHAASSSRGLFLPYAKELSKRGYRCILLDLLGHGSLIDTELTLDNCVNTVRNVLQKEVPVAVNNKTIYVGCSLGAYIGFRILDELSDRFTVGGGGAILMDCGHNVGPDCSYKSLAGLWFMKKLGTFMTNRQLLTAMMSTMTKIDQSDCEVMESIFGSGMYFQQVTNQVNCLHTVRPSKHIPNYNFPILFMNGSLDHRDSEIEWLELCNDKTNNEDQSRNASTNSLSSSLKIYDDGDHFFLHDPRFVQDILDRMDAFAKGSVLK